MFKKLLSLLLFLITISISAQVPSSGLISHYKFTNGSLNDEVSSGASLMIALEVRLVLLKMISLPKYVVLILLHINQ